MIAHLLTVALIAGLPLAKPVPDICKDRSTYVTACATGHGVNTHRDRSND